MTSKRRTNIRRQGTALLNGRNALSNRRRSRGISRVGFVVALTVAATLALPAFSASFGSSGDHHQSARANAQLALSELASFQEQYFLNHKRYTDDLDAVRFGLERTSSSDGGYAFSVELPEGACPVGYCYVLNAVPRGRQAGDECGILSLNSDGEKLPAGCW